MKYLKLLADILCGEFQIRSSTFKFYVINKIKDSEVSKMLGIVFGDDTISQSWICKW